MNVPTRPTRRRTLGRISTALAASTVLSGCLGQDGGAEETTTTEATAEPTTEATAEPTTSPGTEADFRFGGQVSGWVGQAPASIEGQTNPPLQLTPGTTYTVVWENLDGIIHNFVILDANGEALARTEDATEEGATRRVTFEATTAMAGYYCMYHPTSMRGKIAVGTADTSTTTTPGGGYRVHRQRVATRRLTERLSR